MTVKIHSMPDAAIDKREDVLAALISKEVRGIVRKVNAELRAQPLTAAATPEATPVPLTAVEATTLESWQIFVETTAFPFVVDSMTESAGLIAQQMSSATGMVIEPITNEFATEYLQSALKRMVNVGQGLWEDIRKELVAGSEAGESINQIAGRLTQFPSVSAYRARMVARTEVISSLNAGSYIQMLEYDLGPDVTKQWIATEDPRTRISHRHADNQSVNLTEHFTVDIYRDDVKTGDEEMEFPGDPTATPGNVINCRCTLGYSFEEDDVLTASGGDFVESEHPRDNDGKFAKKPGAFLPDLDKLTDNQIGAFIKGLSEKTWANYTPQQRSKILKRAHNVENASKSLDLVQHLSVLHSKATAAPAAPKKARPLGGISGASGKAVKPGKPVFLRVNVLFNTNYDNGAIVAVRPDSDERIIWEDKKMVRQSRVDGTWTTSEKLTRGALMQKYKDEEGWFTPSSENLAAPAAPAAPAPVLKVFPSMKKSSDAEVIQFVESLTQEEWDQLTKQQQDDLTIRVTNIPTGDGILASNKVLFKLKAGKGPGGVPVPATTAAPAPATAFKLGKPVKLKVNILYNKAYADGDIIAERPGSSERLVWDGTTNKINRQFFSPAQNTWLTSESLTRGAAYAKYKDEDGWFTPSVGTPVSKAPEIVAPAPSQPVLPAQTTSKLPPANAPFKFNADVLIGKTSTTYADGQIVAENNGSDTKARLIWNAKTKKYDVQLDVTGSGIYVKFMSFNKQAAYKNYKNAAGWTHPSTKFAGPTADTPVPSVAGNPVPTSFTAPAPKAVKAEKFTQQELKQQAATLVNLTETQQAGIYQNFKFNSEFGSNILLSGKESTTFKALISAQDKFNAANPDNKISLLQVLKSVDAHGATLSPGKTNLNLFEKKIVEWLGTPAGKTSATEAIAEAKLSPAEKKALVKAKAAEKLKKFNEIKLSEPSTDPNAVFKAATHSDMLAFQKKMLPVDSMTSAQTSAIQAYTGSGYIEINEALRHPSAHKMTPSVITKIANIQSAMRPVPEDIIVRRGTAAVEDILPSNLAGYKNLIGKTFSDKGFSSTSVSTGFSGKKVQLEILLPKGTPAIYVQPISLHPGEYEVLLAAGTKFQIISAETASDGYKINVKVRVVP